VDRITVKTLTDEVESQGKEERIAEMMKFIEKHTDSKFLLSISRTTRKTGKMDGAKNYRESLLIIPIGTLLKGADSGNSHLQKIYAMK
jgi:hypothetical protein